MDKVVTAVVNVARGFKRAKEQKISFLVLFVFILAVSISGLSRLDLLPEAPKAIVSSAVLRDTTTVLTSSSVVHQAENPMKIEIPSIGLSATIANPTRLFIRCTQIFVRDDGPKASFCRFFAAYTSSESRPIRFWICRIKFRTTILSRRFTSISQPIPTLSII